MDESSFAGFGEEEMKRFAAIEGRADLFETKLLHVETKSIASDKEYRGNILVLTRDPGSANAVVPVMEYLHQRPGVEQHALVDGRAQEILQQRLPTKNIALDSLLGTDQAIERPDVLLTDASSEHGIETYATATYQDVPLVLVEDYYSSSYTYLRSMQERGLRLPEKICVMDDMAKKMLLQQLPELENRIEITGQPAFDRFVHENTAELGQLTRERLELKPTDRFVVFMSNGHDQGELPAMAEEIKNMSGITLGFRKHPRDATSYAEYQAIFELAGIKTVPVEDFTTDEVGAAADVIMTSWSTEGIHGVYRRKPTIHLIDKKYLHVPETLPLPLPSDELGASVGVNTVRELPVVLSDLLQEKSLRRSKLQENMDRYYSLDGKNSERVATLVESYFHNKVSPGDT